MRTLSDLYRDDARARAWWARQHWRYFWYLKGYERLRDLHLIAKNYVYAVCSLWWALWALVTERRVK